MHTAPSHPSRRALALCLPLLTGLVACGDDAGGDPAATTAEAIAAVDSAAIVSDWLNRRVDLIDLAALAPDATRDDVVVASLDLSAYDQVPLNAEVTPDGKLALVSLSDGFFAIPLAGGLVEAMDIPTGPGRLLFVDLETFEIVGELQTGDGPMGIGISPDGAQAVVAHFGSQALAVVDIEAQTLLDEVQVGIYSEEIDYDDSGSVGIVSYSSTGNVRTFAVDDVSGSLSEGLERDGDAAGVAFFPGTTTAYVVQAPMPLLGAQGGYDVVDVADPGAPVLLGGERFADAPVTYPAAAVPSRGTVVVPGASNGVLTLDEIALRDDGSVEIRQSIDVGEVSFFGAYGAVADADGRVLLSVPTERSVIVVDLEAGTHFSVPWGGAQPGPMDVAIIDR